MRKKYDVCFFFMELSTLLPIIISKALHKKIILLLPSNILAYKISLFSIYMRIVKKINYLMTNKIIMYSKNLMYEWHLDKYMYKTIFLHEHFIDLNRFNMNIKYLKRQNIVGYIGRLSEEKGIVNYVKAILYVLNKRKDIKFIIGGNGSLRDEVESYLEKESLNGKINFLSWIKHDKMPNYLNELKLIVIPSYTEGLPNIMIEAMACGTPVLATSVGAIPDIIKEGETGFLLKNNDPQHIAERIVELLNKPELLERVSIEAFRYVTENFSYEKTLDIWRQIFKETLYVRG